MAGDWIKMRHDLQDDPAVIGMAADLSCNEYMVIGMLHKWWGWLDRQSRDGHALNVTSAWLDRYIGVTGFATALQKHGWLRGQEQAFEVPNFDRHNGKPAKNRALSAERKSRQRSREASRTERDENVTREEKRRVSPPKSPSGGLTGDKSPSKPKRSPPPVNAPQHAFVAYARSVGIEARPGESDQDFRNRVTREVASADRVAA